MGGRARRRGSLLLAGAGIFFLSSLGTYAGTIPAPRIEVEWTRPNVTGYEPRLRAERGPELALIYIGSSGCSPSNREPLPEMVEALKLRLREKAHAGDRSFTTIGIARDWSVEAGMDHLRKFGRFDEVMAGRNWLNTGVSAYVWDGVPGRASTPQVLLVHRWVENGASGEEGGGYAVRDEELVMRKVGFDEIRRWVEQGAPIPMLDPVETAGARSRTGSSRS